jgi:hypothetical protein
MVYRLIAARRCSPQSGPSFVPAQSWVHIAFCVLLAEAEWAMSIWPSIHDSGARSR